MAAGTPGTGGAPAPGGRALTRRQRTPAQLLEVIRSHGGLTRAELSRLTGLSRSTVAHAVADLLASGLLTQEEAPGSRAGRRGRPSVLLRPARRPGQVIGVDFGHVHISVAVADTSGRVLAEARARADVDADADAALDLAARLAADVLGRAGLAMAGVLAVGAGIPGPLEGGTRALGVQAIMAGWDGREVARELTGRFGRPVAIGNDADLGALGELRSGAARGCRDFVYVKVSHGLGAGLVLGGRLYRGTRGIAGEIAHVPVPGSSGRCLCGNRGCVATLTTVWPLRRRLARLGLADTDSGWPQAPLPEHPAVSEVLGEAGAALGQVLAGLCDTLNPEAVILGGEVGVLGGPFTAAVRAAIDRHAQPAAAAAVRVHPAGLGTRSELMGAIALAADTAAQPGPGPG